MSLLKVGDRVYYSIYYEYAYFSEAPSTNQILGIIETITPFEGAYVITLVNINYTLVLYYQDNGNIMKGDALHNAGDPTEREDVAKAFITQNYLNYSRETVLYYHRLLNKTPKMEKDWNGNLAPSWAYTTTLASLNKFLKRLEGSEYEELYPEDFI